eukprot:6342651-Amphidinium_carterae.1
MEYSSGQYFAGFTGYGGREGVYIPSSAMRTVTGFPDFYRFYYNASTAAQQGFLLHGDSRLLDVIGAVETAPPLTRFPRKRRHQKGGGASEPVHD